MKKFIHVTEIRYDLVHKKSHLEPTLLNAAFIKAVRDATPFDKKTYGAGTALELVAGSTMMVSEDRNEIEMRIGKCCENDD